MLVLVEPAGPLNVGSVARLCANFNIGQLRLVAPRCNPLDPEALRMAVKGKLLLKSAHLFDSLSQAIADCDRVVASSGRRQGVPLPINTPGNALNWLLAEHNSSGQNHQALVFGREGSKLEK